MVPCCPDEGRNVNSEIAPGSLKTLTATVSLIIFSIKILWYKKHQFYLRKLTSYISFLNFINFCVLKLSYNWGSTLTNISFFMKEALSHVVLLPNFTSSQVSVIWSSFWKIWINIGTKILFYNSNASVDFHQISYQIFFHVIADTCKTVIRFDDYLKNRSGQIFKK